MPETDARGGTGGGIGRTPRPDSRRRTPPLLPHDHPWKACGSRRSSAPHQRGDGGQDQAGWRYFMTPQSGSQSDMIGSFCRIYSVLLYAYPREFRLQYGAAMQQVFRDRCRDLARTADPFYLYQQTGTLQMDRLGGLLRRIPFIGAALMMAAFAGCGLPGFANFAGEIIVFFGAWKAFPLVTLLACWGALIVEAVYMLRAVRAVLHGPLPDQWATVADAPHLWRKAPFILLLADRKRP